MRKVGIGAEVVVSAFSGSECRHLFARCTRLISLRHAEIKGRRYGSRLQIFLFRWGTT